MQLEPSSRFPDDDDALSLDESDPHKAEVVRYAIGHCSIGFVVVAKAARGICATLLGDDHTMLLASLQNRLPRAILTEAREKIGDLLMSIVRLIEKPTECREIGFSLELRGTAFQRRVWEALRQIPTGQTITYAELARRVGSPRAVRAVASACGANPVAVAVPCHRVIGSDGKLTGYRWGVERKRLLLEREGARQPS
jgi:AraC family transcriptional regulator of adaptative response/methylated-DNA-[protein]-cysteine methyltransferase